MNYISKLSKLQLLKAELELALMALTIHHHIIIVIIIIITITFHISGWVRLERPVWLSSELKTSYIIHMYWLPIMCNGPMVHSSAAILSEITSNITFRITIAKDCLCLYTGQNTKYLLQRASHGASTVSYMEIK